MGQSYIQSPQGLGLKMTLYLMTSKSQKKCIAHESPCILNRTEKSVLLTNFLLFSGLNYVALCTILQESAHFSKIIYAFLVHIFDCFVHCGTFIGTVNYQKLSILNNFFLGFFLFVSNKILLVIVMHVKFKHIEQEHYF